MEIIRLDMKRATLVFTPWWLESNRFLCTPSGRLILSAYRDSLPQVLPRGLTF